MPAVSYEITARVSEGLRADFEKFMIERHIPDLLATGSFTEATFRRSLPGLYRVTYEAASRQSLEEYIANHAPKLRSHVKESFPTGIEFDRQEWEVLATFEHRVAG